MNNTNTENNTPVAQFNSSPENKFVKSYVSNVESDLIEITEDKLENILLKYLHQIDSNQSWITPLSLFLTIILVITTASFTDKLGLKQGTWESMFNMAALITFIWLCISLYKLYISERMSIDKLISKIKDT